MNTNNKEFYFKRAWDFFFLFFLHGFSIGNGQQGISYNVKNMKCTGLKAVSYPDTQMIIKGSTVQISTDTSIFYIWC